MGSICAGHSTLDQSPITGESVPVEKEAGDSVFAGSINGDGALEVEVTKLANDTTMARVVEMVEEAQSQKSPSQTFAEKFERRFVPMYFGRRGFGGDRAAAFGLAVLGNRVAARDFHSGGGVAVRSGTRNAGGGSWPESARPRATAF